MSNQPVTYGGVIDDPRPDEAQAKDYKAEEVAFFTPVDWWQKPRDSWREYPIRIQNGSLTCVAQTGAKILGVENDKEEQKFIDFSALDIYDRRANKPSGGMWGQDALKILCSGATTEARIPSQNLTEAQCNREIMREDEDISIAQTFRAGGYVQLPFDIEAIASIIEHQKKSVMLFFKFDYSEWTDVPFLKPGSRLSCHHSVTGVDATIYDDEKAIIIDDSWGVFFGFKGQRVITESFLKERCTFAGYVLDLKNEPQTTRKPFYKFIRNLTFGERNSGPVKCLQEILQYEGFFPAKVPLTGNYLQITAKGLLQWQLEHEVAPAQELLNLGGRYFGPKTRAKMNQIYV